MSTTIYQPEDLRVRLAAADLSGLTGRAVVLNSSNKFAQNTTAGGRIYGLLVNDPVQDAEATVQIRGQAMGIVGSAITVGQNLMSDNVGRLVPATSTNQIVGVALESVSTVGAFVSVELAYLGVA